MDLGWQQVKGWVLGVSGIEREGDAHVGLVGPRWRTGPAGEDGPVQDQLGPTGWGRGEGARPLEPARPC